MDNVIKEAQLHLAKINHDKWGAYKASITGGHDQILDYLKASVQRGSDSFYAGVCVFGEEKTVAHTGNGPLSEVHAEFIAKAPEIIKGLLDMIDMKNTRIDNLLTNIDAHIKREKSFVEHIDELHDRNKELVKKWKEQDKTIDKVCDERQKFEGKLVEIEDRFKRLQDRTAEIIDDLQYQKRSNGKLRSSLREAFQEQMLLRNEKFSELNITNLPLDMKEGVKYLVVEEAVYEELELKIDVLNADIDLWRIALSEASGREDKLINKHAQAEEKNVMQEKTIDELQEQIKELGWERCTCGWETNQCIEGEIVEERQRNLKQANARIKELEKERCTCGWETDDCLNMDPQGCPNDEEVNHWKGICAENPESLYAWKEYAGILERKLAEAQDTINSFQPYFSEVDDKLEKRNKKIKKLQRKLGKTKNDLHNLSELVNEEFVNRKVIE